ncbi:Tetratricopeptide repeat protein 28 [Stylophora pistillata]|uniref:Tetratricopeptide repeat protein 28 n=1 Tax=Stylophora pistillata TaxID=50429 RepID=A0A2B4RKL4_STYPI|nr:Tetratricopeptide repeat protein 28 [Stylophora pistillata]
MDVAGVQPEDRVVSSEGKKNANIPVSKGMEPVDRDVSNEGKKDADGRVSKVCLDTEPGGVGSGEGKVYVDDSVDESTVADHAQVVSDELKLNSNNDTSSGENVKALLAADDGRAQALRDLMEMKYGIEQTLGEPSSQEKSVRLPLVDLPSNVVFSAINEGTIFFWVIQNGKDVSLRMRSVNTFIERDEVALFIQMLLKELGVKFYVNSQKRSDGIASDDPMIAQKHILKQLYDLVIAPIADLVNGNELIFVPEGPLCLVPYAALLDLELKFLCESFKIRLTPSLKKLKLLSDYLVDFHLKTGALLVGDPCLKSVLHKGKKLAQLLGARKEVKMLGQALQTIPLVGEKATKNEVLKRLSSVSLIHIAAHGQMGTGEIILAPNPERANRQPKEEDYP